MAAGARPPAAIICGRTQHVSRHMIELNPIRQRIADLTGRLDALRGFL
jgi:hypothetical protein